MFYRNPDDQDIRCKADVDIKLNQLVIEQCQDILLSLVKVVPDFRIISTLEDLYTNKLHSPSYNQPSLYRLLKQQTPFYYIKKRLIKKSGIADQRKIELYQEGLIDE